MNWFASTDRPLALATFVTLLDSVLETSTSAPGTRDALAEAYFTGICTGDAGSSNPT